MSFKYRFILSFVTIEAFFLGLIVFINFNAINQTAQDLIRQRVESASVLFSELIKAPIAVFDLATLDETTESAANLEGIASVQVLDPNGNLLSQSLSELTEETLNRISKAASGERIVLQERIFEIEKLDLEIEGALVGHVLMVFDLTASIERIDQNRQKSYLIIAVEILLSTLLSYFIGYRLTHSLGLLTKSANNLAKDENAEVPSIKSQDEIGVLGSAMKKMQEKIQARTQKLAETAKELEELNRSLEQRVEEEVEKNREKDKLMLRHSRQAAMGEMIGMIAHQWRQPLAGMSMSINNMLLDIEMKMVDDETFTKQLEGISNQIKFLSSTIDDFRNFFKPEKEPESITAEKIITDTMDIIGKSLENENIDVKIDILQNVPFMTYRNELIQVLLNLMKNAQDVYKDQGKSGTIHITASETEEHLVIGIQDEAGGIPEEILPRIFEPYFSTKNEKTGTGLGLYMCKTVVEEHIRGQICAQNRGGGAYFEIKHPKSLD